MVAIQIIIFTAAAFFVDVFTGGMLSRSLVLDPGRFMQQPWTLITSIFLHGSIVHLFFNMFGLLIFGPLLEAKIGSRNFIFLYFASGIIGNIGYVLTSGLGGLPVLGASGAIYGILGCLAVIQPNLMVLVMFIPMPIYLAAVFWFFMEFSAGVTGAQPGIANFAHLFGLFGGLLYGRIVKKKIIAKGGWMHEEQ